MATTRLTDIVPVKQFTSVTEGKLTENSKFRQAGLVGTDPRITANAQQAGLETTLREWMRPAGGEATNGSDDSADKLVPSKVQQASMTARKLTRSNSFAAMAIADYASDSQAIAFATSEFARLRAADEESVMLAIMAGVEADNVANHGSDMIADVSTQSTIADANYFGAAALIAGRKTLGDAGSQMKILIAHSDVINMRREAQPNAFVPAAQTNIGLETYMGYIVVETDNVGIDTSGTNPVYTSYLAAPNIFGYASCPIDNALEMARDPFAGSGVGEDTVINRFRYLMHLTGYSNVVAPTNGVSQTNAELASDATWTRVVSRKAIPLVAIKSNG